jgi:hypothetical protein
VFSVAEVGYVRYYEGHSGTKYATFRNRSVNST